MSPSKRPPSLRPLNECEQSAITKALLRMAKSNARDAWVAQTMIDEEMHLSLWWMNRGQE